MDDEAALNPSTVLRGPTAALRGLLQRPLASYYLLLASSGLLLVIGLVMVFSATSVQSYAASGNPFATASKQAVYALIGLVAFWFAQRLPAQTYRSIAAPLMVISLSLLVILDGVDGLHSLGVISASRIGPLAVVDQLWLYVGPVQLQPSELAKLALAIWGAGVLARHGPHQKRFGDLARTLFPLAFVTLILIGYNDLGTMICMLILFFGLMYAAGVQLRVFAGLIGIGLGGILLLVLTKGYRTARLTGFLHPLTGCKATLGDPCYQALEGRYAIANGGWFGVGLGQGHLKWGRLPNGHNDFIFAVIAEELGVVGCFVVIALLAVLAYTGLRIARRVSDPFRRIVATGITAWLVGQATINIGGVTGLLPITGLPLPFISDGGSALVVVLGAVGVLASFARAEPDAARALHARPPDKWVRLVWAPLPPLPRPDGEDAYDDLRRKASAAPAADRPRAVGPRSGRLAARGQRGPTAVATAAEPSGPNATKARRSRPKGGQRPAPVERARPDPADRRR